MCSSIRLACVFSLALCISRAARSAAAEAPLAEKYLLEGKLEQGAHPQTLSYAAARQILQTWVDDVMAAEANLAQVKDPAV